MFGKEPWYDTLFWLASRILLLMGVPYLMWAVATLLINLVVATHQLDNSLDDIIRAVALLGVSALLAMLREMDRRLTRIEERLKQPESADKDSTPSR